MLLAMKAAREEQTGKILDEIERAEKIFKKMFHGGEFEEEIRRAVSAKQAATVIRRSMR